MIAVVLILLLLLGGYVWAYFALSDYYQLDQAAFRSFRPAWRLSLFSPLAKVEFVIRGHDIHLCHWPILNLDFGDQQNGGCKCE
jgi:hypothetical protein